MDDINSQADENFPELRKQVEDHDPDICVDQRVRMTDEECRRKIINDIEEQVLMAGIIASVVCLVIASVLVLTWRRINALRAAGPTDPNDEVEFQNPVENTLEEIAKTAAAKSFDSDDAGNRSRSRGFKYEK